MRGGEAVEPLLNEREAAKLTGHSARTYQAWRWRGGGPPFIKIGSSVRYDPIRLREWLAQRSRRSTTESASASRDEGRR